MHAIQHWLQSRIVFAPEVVGNCRIVSMGLTLVGLHDIQDMETVGPSATVPGIVINVEPRPAFAHAIRKR